MNVLMITRDADVLRDGSPAQAFVKEQARSTNRLMVVVLNSHHRYSVARKVNRSLWLFPTNSWLPFFKVWNALYLVRHEIYFKKRLQTDLVVANDPLTSAFVACLVAYRYKKPLHIYVPNNVFAKTYARRSIWNAFRSAFARMMVGRASTVSVAQETTRALIINRDPVMAERVVYVPPFIDVTATQAQELGDDLHLIYTQFRALILVVAPLVREHNVHIAIEALAKISKDYQRIGLVIVGDGPRKWFLRRQASILGVSDRVMFERPRANLTSYYKTAFAFMVTSLYEAYETTIEDAAAAGCAIITSRVGAAPQLVEHRKNGFLCDPKNAGDYANAVAYLLDSEHTRQEIKRNIILSAQAYMVKDKDAHLLTFQKSWEQAIHTAHGY
jgi:glycosyltransferase involved in cell wall biosynthesis